jgi:transcriptional regulator with XRE-family HTH domain
MRRSPKRHALAILRLKLGLTQKEMARLADCSTVTIQSIELGRLPVSRTLANHISMLTGVSRDWLQAGDPNRPVVTDEGNPYTPETFEMFGAALLWPGRSGREELTADENAAAILASGLLQLYCIIRQAQKSGRLMLTASKIHTAIAGLIDKFGVDPDVARQLKTHKFDFTGDTLQQAVDFINHTMASPAVSSADQVQTTRPVHIMLSSKRRK